MQKPPGYAHFEIYRSRPWLGKNVYGIKSGGIFSVGHRAASLGYRQASIRSFDLNLSNRANGFFRSSVFTLPGYETALCCSFLGNASHDCLARHRQPPKNWPGTLLPAPAAEDQGWNDHIDGWVFRVAAPFAAMQAVLFELRRERGIIVAANPALQASQHKAIPSINCRAVLTCLPGAGTAGGGRANPLSSGINNPTLCSIFNQVRVGSFHKTPFPLWKLFLSNVPLTVDGDVPERLRDKGHGRALTKG